MRLCPVLSVILAVGLLNGCTQAGQRQTTLAQNSGYQKNFQPLPDDPPDVVVELAAARADSASGEAAMRAHNPAAALAFMQKSKAELEDVNKKRMAAQAPGNMQRLRAIAVGSAPEAQSGLTRAAAAEMLGEYYEKGLGVPQDYAVARFWYEIAISFHEGGIESTRATAELAHLLGQGLGGPQEVARSEQLIHSIGQRTHADTVAEDKRAQEQMAAMMVLMAAAASRRGPSRQPEESESGPNMFTCHFSMKVSPLMAGAFGGCPPWTP
jgi:hypothetical protein